MKKIECPEKILHWTLSVHYIAVNSQQSGMTEAKNKKSPRVANSRGNQREPQWRFLKISNGHSFVDSTSCRSASPIPHRHSNSISRQVLLSRSFSKPSPCSTEGDQRRLLELTSRLCPKWMERMS